MNHYLKAIDGVVLITSIGLDGEEIDQVNFLEKPEIVVKTNYLVATAVNTLSFFTCSYEIVKETNITTSIGKVVIVKALSEGKALVAGPAKVSDIQKLIEDTDSLMISKILIDGAFSRHAFSRITQATVLVIGANHSIDVDKVVKNAELLVKVFSLESVIEPCFDNKTNICFLDSNRNVTELPFSSIIGRVDDFFDRSFDSIKTVYFPKTLTNKFIERLVKERHRCHFDIVINSPVNIQAKDHYLEILFKLKNRIMTLNSLQLASICYNPYSPRGYEFDDSIFKQKLENALGREVINVLKEVKNGKT